MSDYNLLALNCPRNFLLMALLTDLVLDRRLDRSAIGAGKIGYYHGVELGARHKIQFSWGFVTTRAGNILVG